MFSHRLEETQAAMVRLTTATGASLLLTPDHSLLVRVVDDGRGAGEGACVEREDLHGVGVAAQRKVRVTERALRGSCRRRSRRARAAGSFHALPRTMK